MVEEDSERKKNKNDYLEMFTDKVKRNPKRTNLLSD